MNNKIKFGYEDTDRKVIIDLYGLEFEVKNIDEEKIKELDNVEKNINELEKIINDILGDGAVDKINAKRIADGHDKMDLQIEMAVFSCIFQAYAKVMSESALNGINNTLEDINNRTSEVRNYNRNQRRNYRGNRYRRY